MQRIAKLGLCTTLYKLTNFQPSYCEENYLNKFFSFKTRQEHLEEIKQTEEYDVVIIGGGATGVGALLSASHRQLKTCLIESGDFGCSTSTKSTKLLHGGLRYW